MNVVCVISDTHGLVRSEAVEVLRGSELIIHAGDVGDPHVLDRLEQIALTIAVRGNVDTAPWARSLPATKIIEVGDLPLYMLHDLVTLDLDPKAARCAAVIYGHSHQPKAEMRVSRTSS